MPSCGDFADHLAAAIKRRHGGQVVIFAVKHADAGRAIKLVSGEGVEIAIDVLHVDVGMHRALCAVDQHRNAVGVRDPRHLFHRHQRAQHVRHVGDGDHFGAGPEQLLEFVDEKMSLVVDRRPFDHRALPLAQKMPGHDVGMVLHDREHDLVAGLDPLAPERIGDEVDGLGRIAGEDDLFLAPGIEERRYFFARAFISLGRLVGEVVQSAMHVGVLRGVGLLNPVENRTRLLRRRSVVEIHQRFAVDLKRQGSENPRGSD